MSSIVIAGDTSGSVTLQAPAVAGSTTVNLPSTLGNTSTSAFATTDASGNLGLGITPSAWNSAYKALQVGVSSVLWSTGTGGARLGVNYFLNSADSLRYISSNVATDYRQSNGEHQFFTAASGTAGNAISFTQAMTLDANGNLCIGSTSVTNVSGYKTISLQGSTQGGIFESTTGSYTTKTRMYSTDSGGFVGTTSNHFLGFLTNDAERARITAAGELLLTGLTSPITSGILCIATNLNNNNPVVLKNTTTQGAGQTFAVFTNSSNAQAGAIQHSGTTSVTYSTSSDARLKTDLGVSVSTDVIDNTIVHDYEWKEDKKIDRGVFAQEAFEVKPTAVAVGNDELTEDGNLAKPWGVDYSKYVPDLIVYAQQLKKQVQEQQALITTLTERITALEGV
jgi:hypothetical protein